MSDRARPFWYVRPDWPPWPPVMERRQISPPGPERLCISWGHAGRGLKPAEKRRAIREWLEVLPCLRGVRYLWVESKVMQEVFDSLCTLKELEGLSLHWNQASDLGRLARMQGLRHLHLGNSSAAESIAALGHLSELRTLSVSNLRHVRDLAPLGQLRKLEELQVEGSMWRTQRVATLGPIGSLTNLRKLSLTNLRADDRTLSPLFSLRRLEYFASARWWDPAELAELHRRNPNLDLE